MRSRRPGQGGRPVWICLLVFPCPPATIGLPSRATRSRAPPMPSRWACLTIVLCWLGLNGYLLYHDLLPRLLPGQPPPYTIDLVEEAQTRRPATDWSVLHEGEPVF